MIFLSKLLQKCGLKAPIGSHLEKETAKGYGWIKFDHLTPDSPNVQTIGFYNPDLLLLMVRKFIEETMEEVNDIRLSTCNCPESDSPYLLIQSGDTDDPSRWFCLGPVNVIDV